MDRTAARPPVDFRPPVESDLNFILSSYAESFRRSPYSGVLPDKPYYDASRDHFESIMGRDGCLVLCCVATEETPPNDLFGWVCWEPGTLHYAYVKHVFRGMGIFRSMLNKTGLSPSTSTVAYTHRNKFSNDYTHGHSAERWRHEPKLARYSRDRESR